MHIGPLNSKSRKFNQRGNRPDVYNMCIYRSTAEGGRGFCAIGNYLLRISESLVIYTLY